VEIHENRGTGRGDRTLFLANMSSDQEGIRKKPLSGANTGRNIVMFYSKCHVTSNKVTSKLECAEDKFQTRGWVRETPPTTSYERDLTRNAGPCSKLRDTCYTDS
jgi:hypothetical protein